ncbi:uncharacterized protein LOC117282748 isoform X3 [Cryptotermes secundus]|uniref:uncharacterized protein LOC117282748 isoform X3 n=1 Tax=Cryptotermes secundus TaxID=105785 RepID=UPI001454DC38|nr:uncharacterized protein LOC117282748 isoform X3 [Cryptotermes secundus]
MAVCVVDVGKEVRRNEFCFRILPSTYHVYTQNWSYSFSTKGTHHLMLLKKSCHLLIFLCSRITAASFALQTTPEEKITSNKIRL